MAEERDGVLTPKQEEFADSLWDNKGILELVDGPIIRAADNIGLQKAKEQIPEEYWPLIYSMVDQLFIILGSKSE